ncbi:MULTISPECIES: shikimate kinase [Selenomonas]|uniref:Shikimate kinase n=1 Tax=Selenomonas ruminis TaxID=2593411 RepID=A0A5D6VVP5_9FIRM|nr:MULTISPECIES: shikimate kinase [unclassified Selenomonas]MBQ1867451.1 shikimate kinase [Selenomonas sp.]TYZ19736.1 shikimate kinase [Selenomonas sp. mPRGC5]
MKNVILIGFMGTGKTSTGKMLASKLGCAFIDMDQKIEEEAGMCIPDIFAQKGEAHFRQLEKDLVERLSARRNAVISTGGGTVKNPDNVAAFKKSGIIICLSASVDAVLERTKRHGTRPVLDQADQGDRRKAVESLMAERKDLYKQADFTVDTSDLSPLQVVDVIVRFLKTRGVLHA